MGSVHPAIAPISVGPRDAARANRRQFHHGVMRRPAAAMPASRSSPKASRRPEQLAFLTSARCDFVQGYLLGRPARAEHFSTACCG
jgi:hypothetical protein